MWAGDDTQSYRQGPNWRLTVRVVSGVSLWQRVTVWQAAVLGREVGAGEFQGAKVAEARDAAEVCLQQWVRRLADSAGRCVMDGDLRYLLDKVARLEAEVSRLSTALAVPEGWVAGFNPTKGYVNGRFVSVCLSTSTDAPPSWSYWVSGTATEHGFPTAYAACQAADAWLARNP